MTENEIAKIVVNTSLKIHKDLGSGLFESVYETILANKLQIAGLLVKRQVAVPIIYDDIEFEEAFRADIIIEDKLILELKSVESISNIHKKQLLTYLKLSHIKLGLIINFNEVLLKDGIVRVINGYLE